MKVKIIFSPYVSSDKQLYVGLWHSLSDKLDHFRKNLAVSISGHFMEPREHIFLETGILDLDLLCLSLDMFYSFLLFVTGFFVQLCSHTLSIIPKLHVSGELTSLLIEKVFQKPTL